MGLSKVSPTRSVRHQASHGHLERIVGSRIGRRLDLSIFVVAHSHILESDASRVHVAHHASHPRRVGSNSHMGRIRGDSMEGQVTKRIDKGVRVSGIGCAVSQRSATTRWVGGECSAVALHVGFDRSFGGYKV